MTGPGALGAVLSDAGIEVFCLGMRRGLPDPRGLTRFAGILRQVQPDIVQTWLYHADLVGLVDLNTEEGDTRFRQIRVRFLAELTEALAEVFHRFQEEGRLPADLEPRASAGALVSMLAHVAAHRYGFEFWGIRTKDLRASMARSLYWGITGQKPA